MELNFRPGKGYLCKLFGGRDLTVTITLQAFVFTNSFVILYSRPSLSVPPPSDESLYPELPLPPLLYWVLFIL